MRLSLRTGHITTALALLTMQPGVAHASDDPQYLRAFGKLYATARLGGLVKEWCDLRAPLTREATDTALAAWKSAHQLDDIEARAASVLGAQLPSIVAAVQAGRESVFRALDQDSKNADAECRQMLSYLNRSADPQRVSPAEFRLVMGQSGRLASAAGAPITTPATTPAPGAKRTAVQRDEIRTPPHRGVMMADIDGVYQPAKLRYNPLTLGFEPDETTYLVLKDGWLYDNLQVSPHDLNVAESRRLEPQHWHRWRRRGGEIEMQAYDEHGRTDGKWSVLKVVARPPVGARRLNGVFSATRSATAGLLGGGGATSIGKSSYTFRPDGTFSWANLTQGFASSDSGTGPGGASIVVGGASVGPGGTSISTVGGSDEAGSYVTDGFTLELRVRSGKVHRFLIFSWDDGRYRDFLVINGTTYSPLK
ncbi:hypothetical protein [Rubrivivax gelatinosus]|uniref:Uncharacterized protein n=1 Tax=Rubrivivax gelatinosus TaxID=28068 RepID=A0A4R2MA62_RUBGE|nr:hypothetical protein [Rubrivivax gelatinosus]MBK1690243.1 hypothetical protein [Rubrivivax gelatinosus]TCP03572.1 hypothetical protein EV684_104295 [Rubrivivax gelatinosus]